ncbi:hypothetical protein [Rhizobium giardinii]|uniref:hypothetical protein n=1 Tax=Rhizobium giardinii TaxID=56731 RepID=UPI003D6EAB8C
MADFPDATNTGVTAGAAMTVYNGTYYVTEDNANISNLEVHGDIVIDADNVTMSNVKLVSNTPWHALRVMDDATGFTLQDSEIDGAGSTVNAIYGAGTFLRNDLHDVDNGINVTGPSEIRDNYIHNLRGGADAHYDGVEVNGGHDIDIIHNTIVNDHGQTSAVMLDNYFGGLSNITVDGNRLVGGGYTVYLDGRFGGGTVDDASIKITNNQIGGGYYGDFALYDDNPVVSGNTDLDTLPTDTTPTDTAPVDTTTTDTVPAGTTATDTTATDAAPADATSTDTAPADTTTTDAAPADTTSTDTAPVDTTATDAAPADTTSTDTAPVDTTATDAAPADTTSTDTAPVDTTVTDAAPADTTPTDTAPADTTATDAAPADTTATDTTSPTAPTHTAQTDTTPGTSSTGTAVESPTTGSAADWGLDGPLEGTYGDTDSVANAANNGAKDAVHNWIKQTFGSNFADKFHGNTHAHAGDSHRNAGSGNDALGADDLMGGSDADTFVFKTADESTSALTGRDSIFDFSGTGGDGIDVADIDANSAASGELRYANQASDTYVYGDTNGDRNADCAVHLDDAVSLSKGYFVL